MGLLFCFIWYLVPSVCLQKTFSTLTLFLCFQNAPIKCINLDKIDKWLALRVQDLLCILRSVQCQGTRCDGSIRCIPFRSGSGSKVFRVELEVVGHQAMPGSLRGTLASSGTCPATPAWQPMSHQQAQRKLDILHPIATNSFAEAPQQSFRRLGSLAASTPPSAPWRISSGQSVSWQTGPLAGCVWSWPRLLFCLRSMTLEVFQWTNHGSQGGYQIQIENIEWESAKIPSENCVNPYTAGQASWPRRSTNATGELSLHKPIFPRPFSNQPTYFELLSIGLKVPDSIHIFILILRGTHVFVFRLFLLRPRSHFHSVRSWSLRFLFTVKYNEAWSIGLQKKQAQKISKYWKPRIFAARKSPARLGSTMTAIPVRGYWCNSRVTSEMQNMFLAELTTPAQGMFT